MGVTWTWEKCVRDIVMCADPAKVGDLAVGWRTLADDLARLVEDVSGRTVGNAYNAAGAAYQTEGGLLGKLSAWRGSGGAAYVEHVAALGAEISELESDAMRVSSALSRISEDLRKALAKIPIPVGGDFSWHDFDALVLPNGTALNVQTPDAKEKADKLASALAADYAADPSSYADGAFLKEADKLDETLKFDGKSGWSTNWRGGVYDTNAFLNDWYNDCTRAARSGASPVPPAIADERPNLVVGNMTPDPRTYVADNTSNPDGYDPGSHSPSSGADFSGTAAGAPSVGAYAPGASDWLTDSPGSEYVYGDQVTPGSGLAGVSGSTLGGLGAGGGGSLGGVGSTGVVPGGGLPGAVSSGARGVSPLTSPGVAVRTAIAGQTPGVGGAGGLMGGMGAGGGRGAGSAKDGGERRTRLKEDPSMWNPDIDVAPGVIG